MFVEKRGAAETRFLLFPPPLAVGECGRCLFFSGALWSEQHRRGCGAVREGGGGRQREEERWGGGTSADQPAVISFHTPARSRHTPSLLPYPSVNTLRSSPAPPTLLTEHPPPPPEVSPALASAFLIVSAVPPLPLCKSSPLGSPWHAAADRLSVRHGRR